MSKFFKVIVHNDVSSPNLLGICAGYENKCWRADQLVDYIFEFLPEFALNQTELENFTSLNVVGKIRKAASAVYQTEKFRNRGEFGELLLHSIIRETKDTIPAISKIYYKDGPNETVKGFDAVHVVVNNDDLELWLGEVKFYQNIYNAISDVITELEEHSESKYLKNEFIAISNKIDNSWKHAERLKNLLDPKTSLDDVFDSIVIPVLLTYDSKIIEKHEKFTDDYVDEIKSELERLHNNFSNKIGDFPLTVHLFLLPLNTKKALVTKLEEKLKVWQSL
ncbi:DUF1837 domain-containing protein [Salegentibacter sp. BLCTC]|uniref:HamA C-terminal domain-containing protein n=1 Tax=Salegentibacter sp. BLCTC TaxID=2697368 RepID=UPI00187B408D|nr:DUF1837 domain-containing protein [Salegentibacter sp. BLCTC]MBE7641404.1 DUF1837 domain-containing protein [Salegentibacter sp. BLCTC]